MGASLCANKTRVHDSKHKKVINEFFILNQFVKIIKFNGAIVNNMEMKICSSVVVSLNDNLFYISVLIILTANLGKIF